MNAWVRSILTVAATVLIAAVGTVFMLNLSLGNKRIGVQIYEYEPAMFHCKVMVVDGRWVSLGSSNFDMHSFSINDETTLNVLDADFAAREAAVFEHDLTLLQPVTLLAWNDRPWTEKALDQAASLVASQF